MPEARSAPGPAVSSGFALRAAPLGPSAPSDGPVPGRGPGCRPPRSAVRNMRGLFQTADQDGSAQRRREQGTKTLATPPSARWKPNITFQPIRACDSERKMAQLHYGRRVGRAPGSIRGHDCRSDVFHIPRRSSLVALEDLSNSRARPDTWRCLEQTLVEPEEGQA